MTDYPNNIPAKLEIIKASEITPRKVRWQWYPYKVTLLQGDPGDGKSKLMLSLAALLSKGAPLPFADEDESGEPMTVIYQTTEDDADDTVVPRFNSAGGDGDRLIFIKEDEKSLTFGDDRISEAVEKYHAKLLILDPMSSYIGDTCSMNNANETRAEFNHLIAVAKDTGCTIVITAHMNKAKDTSPLYRTNGSIDIAGAARSILAVTRTANKQNPAERYTSGENLRRGSAENRATQRAQERKLRKSQCRHRANCPQCSLQGHGRFDLQRVFPAVH